MVASLSGGRRRIAQRGFTLVELLFVVLIVSVLLAIAVPSFVSFMSSNRATATANALMSGITSARGEALARARRVYFGPLDGSWKNGWVVFVDRNDNRAFDRPLPGDPPIDILIFEHGPVPETITIVDAADSTREPFLDNGSPARAYVMFDGTGYPRHRNGAMATGGLVVVDRMGAATSVRTLCVGLMGRAKVSTGVGACQ